MFRLIKKDFFVFKFAAETGRKTDVHEAKTLCLA